MYQFEVIIPVFNEGANIRAALERIEREVRGCFEVVIVYDFDQDDTLPALDEAQKTLRIPVRRVKNRYGRGALNALKTGLEQLQAPYGVITMADLCDPPEVINAMLECAERSGAAVVCGSRYMPGGSQTGGPRLKKLLSRCAGMSLYYLRRLPVRDATNSFKLYAKSFLDGVTVESTDGFTLGLELAVKAHKMGLAVREVPSGWVDRVAGESHFPVMKWLPCYLKWYFKAF